MTVTLLIKLRTLNQLFSLYTCIVIFMKAINTLYTFMMFVKYFEVNVRTANSNKVFKFINNYKVKLRMCGRI